ncbi:MAG: class I SAM-dependent methyltransferase [Calditrichaeota bacterium]|nr:class I SAM-dependent methyltransferase [Calditrichota bacterium]
MVPAEISDSDVREYQDFLKNPLVEYQRSMIHELLRSFLNRNKKILDVGCGPGADFDFYKSLSLEIDAIDISREMILAARRQAQRLGLRARIARSSLQDFVPDALYDTIILNFGVINEMENLTESLKKIRTILKPDGYAIIISRPSFHLFSFLTDLVKLRINNLRQRMSQKQFELQNGIKLRYYNEKDFKNEFSIMHRENYCSFIPSPEQYKNSAFARIWTKMFISLDQKYSAKIPDKFGGDFVCYVLKANRQQTKSK